MTDILDHLCYFAGACVLLGAAVAGFGWAGWRLYLLLVGRAEDRWEHGG